MFRSPYYAFLTFLILFFGRATYALEKLGPPTTPDGGTLYNFVRTIIGIIIKLAIPALVVIIVFFAFRIVAAQGDEKALTEARHRFKIVLLVTTIFLGLGLIATIIYSTGNSVGYVKLFSSSPTPFDSEFDAEIKSSIFK